MRPRGPAAGGKIDSRQLHFGQKVFGVSSNVAPMETRPSGFLANRSICKGQDAVGHARRSGLVARREIERTIIHIVVFSVLSTVQQQFLNEQIVSEQSAMSTQSGCVLVNLAPYSFSSAPLNLGASRIRGCGHTTARQPPSGTPRPGRGSAGPGHSPGRCCHHLTNQKQSERKKRVSVVQGEGQEVAWCACRVDAVRTHAHYFAL